METHLIAIVCDDADNGKEEEERDECADCAHGDGMELGIW